MRLILTSVICALLSNVTIAAPPSMEAILHHSRAFYDIAMANNGHRASATPGHVASAAYVEGQLANTGLVLSRQQFSGTFNVIAETSGGDPRNTIILGAHLDSVPTGPGINDNAATVAALLEVARSFAGVSTRNKVKFIFWGGEEWGLVGSNFFVRSLTPVQLADIAFYLNFDMIASPNYLLGVYTGTDYQRNSYGERGSKLLKEAFHREFRELNSISVGFVIGNRGDHAAFAEAGIPTAGLCTGADGHKSRRAARMFGGRSGALLDPCYHQSCDDVSNLNQKALRINAGVMQGMAEAFSQSLGGLAEIRN